MRTTLDLDDHLHAEARRRAFEQRKSLGEVISELALRGLEANEASRPKRVLGRYTGLVHVTDDFNDTPADVAAAMEDPLT